MPFFKIFSNSKFSVSDKNNFKNKVGCGFYPNKNNETQKSNSCHPELASPLVADEKKAYKGGGSQSISGFSHRQKCADICTQKFNVGLKAQPTSTAFTLAEVLITLGIIGVVAAMTLPTLIANYNKQVAATKLKKFYTIMNQAVKLSEAKYGEFQYWDNSFTGYDSASMEAWWDKYFRPHVKTLKIDESSGRSITVYLADGTKLRILNHYTDGSDPSASVSAIHLFFYLNASNKSNIMGKDCFTFFINVKTNKKWAAVEPYKFGWNGKRNDLINNASYGCSASSSANAYYCAALIQMNNWEIPDGYPFKF